jgi:hypothetical protein
MKSDGQWWVVLGDEEPLKCVVFGSEVFGWVRFIRGQPPIVADEKDPEAKRHFGINIWDGKKCRVLTGSQRLYNQILAVHKATAGLEHVWIEIAKQDGLWCAKYAGDITKEELEQIQNAEAEDLTMRCKWAKNDTPL